MSKLTQVFHSLLFTLLMVLPSIAGATLSSPVKSKAHSRAQMVHRLQRLDLPLATTTTDAFTQRKIDDYLGRGGNNTEKMLGRANQYFPVFEYYLHKHGMPSSLKYLAVAESMLVPGATSSASAAGLWQLMPATAREMGLRVDSVIDERLDLHRSTEAAVIMLKELHRQFNDWHLALAAYNCGAGRVRSAIRRAHSRDYEAVNPFLPKETQRYVAAYVAAAYAVNYYDAHGLTPHELDGYESIRVYRQISLAMIARECDVRPATLRRLNPMFLQAYIPTSALGHRLRVPQAEKYRVQQFLWGQPNLVELPTDARIEAAAATADIMGYDPLAILLGCRTTRLVYGSPSYGMQHLRDRMLLSFHDNYRAFASL